MRRTLFVIPALIGLLLAGGAQAQATGTLAAPSEPLPLEGREQTCAQLWRDYTRSQACFNRFRVVGGGLRPEAFSTCGQPLPDPSAQCGPRR